MTPKPNPVFPSILATFCLAGVGLALATLWQVAWFIVAVQDSKLANPPRLTTLLVLLPVLTVLAACLVSQHGSYSTAPQGSGR